MKANWLALVVVLVAVLLVAAPFAAAKSSGPNEGRLDALDVHGKPLGPCPLKHTDVQCGRCRLRRAGHGHASLPQPGDGQEDRSELTSTRCRRTPPWTT